MTITCTVCGTVNPDGTTYCEGCGVELTPQHAAAPTPITPDPAPAAEATAPVDGDLTDPATASVPASPELAAGIPDMPVTDSPEATAPAPASVDDAVSAPVTPEATDPAPMAVAVPVAAPTAAAPAPSDAPAKLGI